MEMLLTILMAPQAGAGQKSNPMMSLLPFLLIIVVIYFFMIRPQSKKAKTQKLFKDTIKRGDKVVTIGGIVGKITEIREKEFEIEISRDVRVTVLKDAISMESTQAVNPQNPQQ